MRIRSVLAAGVTVLAAALLTATVVSSAEATTPTTAARATYSQPLWYPLHDSQAAMDCAWSNPGCPTANRHADHAITWLTHDTQGVYHNAPVYAAGSGIVHIGYHGMGQCSPVAGQPLGNWVWIDHGNGVRSRYAHLYGIKITNGQQVTPRTVLAYSGSSGESAAQCKTKYLNFQIQHGATAGHADGTGFAFKSTYACSGSTRVYYPHAFSPYLAWNDFPKSTFVSGTGWIHMIPHGGHACVSAT